MSGADAKGRKPTFRPEVQGLRALAVVMVVLYHVWLGRVSGGVDVFLLISSFLLTLSFVGKVRAGPLGPTPPVPPRLDRGVGGRVRVLAGLLGLGDRHRPVRRVLRRPLPPV